MHGDELTPDSYPSTRRRAFADITEATTAELIKAGWVLMLDETMTCASFYMCRGKHKVTVFPVASLAARNYAWQCSIETPAEAWIIEYQAFPDVRSACYYAQALLVRETRTKRRREHKYDE